MGPEAQRRVARALRVRLPFPYPLGGEGAGVVVATGPGVSLVVGARVCWGRVLGSCATLITAPASMLAPFPDSLSFEDGAWLAVAGLTAGGLARVWLLRGCSAVVWGAAGANFAVDRAHTDVREAVRAYTGVAVWSRSSIRLALRPMKPVCNSSRRGAV